MEEKLQHIQTQLTERLRGYKLEDKISFDETALEELSNLSGGGIATR